MADHRLNVIQKTPPSLEPSFNSSRTARTRELQAKFERLWLKEPERFNPLRNSMERER